MSLSGLLQLLGDDFPGCTEGTKVGTGQSKPQICRPQGGETAVRRHLWLQSQAPTLVLTPRAEDSRRLHDQLATYAGETAPVYLLPEPEVLPFERLAVDARTVNQRLVALSSLSSWQQGARSAPLVIASTAAAMRFTLVAGSVRDS